MSFRDGAKRRARNPSALATLNLLAMTVDSGLAPAARAPE
jgi:hypothetical protein